LVRCLVCISFTCETAIMVNRWQAWHPGSFLPELGKEGRAKYN